MGATQSSRKLSIENDEQANVIKISDSLVDRLRGSSSSSAEDVSRHSHHSPQRYHPAPMHYYSPSFTALEVKKEMEEKLVENNKYWMRRLEELELAHKKIDHIMEQEFEASVQNVKESFKKLPATHSVPPCLEGKARLIECYTSNMRKPIECANEVKQFASCVNQQRAALLHNRG